MSTRSSISTTGPSTGVATRMNKNEPPHMAESKSNAHTSFAFIPLSPLLMLALSIRQKQQKNYPILALQIEQKDFYIACSRDALFADSHACVVIWEKLWKKSDETGEENVL